VITASAPVFVAAERAISPASPAPRTIHPNVSIDYNQTTHDLSRRAIGMAESGYRAPNVLANDAVEQRLLQRLGVDSIRIHLTYSVPGDPTSKIVCSGSGCDTRPNGDEWIGAIKNTGAEPIVIVESRSSIDAANMVRRFNIDPITQHPDPARPSYVPSWIIGNEPNANGGSSSSYAADFNAAFDAMKAVDPRIEIGGPAAAWYDDGWITQFLQLSGSRVDFVDFHGYPQQGTRDGDVATLFRWARNTGDDVARLRRVIEATVPDRALDIEIQVGEWSLNWGGNAQVDTNFNAVWTADVLGNILENGGRSIYFATKGNAIKWADGWAVDDAGHRVFMRLDDPRAAYHGYGMFTGEGLFRSFGNTVVSAMTTLSNIEVFASDNPRNIVVINKEPASTQRAVFSLSGVTSATVAVWQKHPGILFNAPPEQQESVSVRHGAFSITLPPMSVTTFVIDERH
jgi:Glycosyl hydrolases family 39